MYNTFTPIGLIYILGASTSTHACTETHQHAQTQTQTPTDTHRHTHTHTHTHTQTYTHTHTYTKTYTHTPQLSYNTSCTEMRKWKVAVEVITLRLCIIDSLEEIRMNVSRESIHLHELMCAPITNKGNGVDIIFLAVVIHIVGHHNWSLGIWLVWGPWLKETYLLAMQVSLWE